MTVTAGSTRRQERAELIERALRHSWRTRRDRDIVTGLVRNDKIRPPLRHDARRV